MAKIKTGQFDKFSFDTDFFELSVPNQPSAPQTPSLQEPEPELDLEALKAEAYAAGHAAGIKEAQEGQREELQAALSAFNQAADKVADAQTQYLSKLTSQALTILAQSLQHLVGDAAHHYSEEILHKHLQTVLTLLPKEDNLVLRIHPKARQFHDKLTGQIANIKGVIFKIETDDTLALGDCAVMWEGGGVDTVLAFAAENMATLLQSYKPNDTAIAANLAAQEAELPAESSSPSPEASAKKSTDEPQEDAEKETTLEETDTPPIAQEEELA